MKKRIALLLALILALSCVPCYAGQNDPAPAPVITTKDVYGVSFVSCYIDSDGEAVIVDNVLGELHDSLTIPLGLYGHGLVFCSQTLYYLDGDIDSEDSPVYCPVDDISFFVNGKKSDAVQLSEHRDRSRNMSCYDITAGEACKGEFLVRFTNGDEFRLKIQVVSAEDGFYDGSGNYLPYDGTKEPHYASLTAKAGEKVEFSFAWAPDEGLYEAKDFSLISRQSFNEFDWPKEVKLLVDGKLTGNKYPLIDVKVDPEKRQALFSGILEEGTYIIDVCMEYYPGPEYITGLQKNRDILLTIEKNDKLPIFEDVEPDAYYAEAVNWAAANNVTSGDGKGHFNPKGLCDRATVVTFLWNLAGQPVPESQTRFNDVKSDAWYSAAVTWAVEQGITSGTGNGNFSPTTTCSNAHVLTFLWNYMGKPEPEGPVSESIDPSVSWAAKALTWADETGLTEAISGASVPKGDCPRQDIVTFMYRYSAK